MRILFPNEAIEFLRFSPNENMFVSRSGSPGELELITDRSLLAGPDGLALPALAPLTAYFFEIDVA